MSEYVVPAYAGIIPALMGLKEKRASSPRVSGDDPAGAEGTDAKSL